MGRESANLNLSHPPSQSSFENWDPRPQLASTFFFSFESVLAFLSFFLKKSSWFCLDPLVTNN